MCGVMSDGFQEGYYKDILQFEVWDCFSEVSRQCPAKEK